jgi:hypothetical protein
MKRINGVLLCVAIIAAMTSGCAEHDPAAKDAVPHVNGRYRAETEPEGAVPVGQARTTAVDQDPVVVEGRIGGSVKPFIDGLAAFTIVDPQVPSCAGEEGCPTPWDYCCQQDAVRENSAMVKLVDAEGGVLGQDARELLGVKELNLVVVKGIAKRDAEGNLSVAASEVYIKE